VYAWQRLIDPRLAAPNGPFFAGAILNGEQVSGLDPQRDASQIPTALGTLGLKAVDDFTLQVTLAHPNPAFAWLAAMPAGGPIRQDVVTKYAYKWASSPDSLVTNGPFRVTEMVPNVHLTVVPNPHYWGPRPTLTGINFLVINDGAAALAKYPGATVQRVETDSDGVYEAHLLKADGTPVTVEVNKAFAVTGLEARGGPPAGASHSALTG